MLVVAHHWNCHPLSRRKISPPHVSNKGTATTTTDSITLFSLDDDYISHYEDGELIMMRRSKQLATVSQPKCDFDTSSDTFCSTQQPFPDGDDIYGYEDGQLLIVCHSTSVSRTRVDCRESSFMDRGAATATNKDAKMPACNTLSGSIETAAVATFSQGSVRNGNCRCFR
jgi:hypothetical protein